MVLNILFRDPTFITREVLKIQRSPCQGNKKQQKKLKVAQNLTIIRTAVIYVQCCELVEQTSRGVQRQVYLDVFRKENLSEL